MKSSVRIMSIAGIDIGIHYSWLLIFVLVITTLALGFFRNTMPDLNTGAYWGAGTLAALMLFLSVLIHELAHSLVAKARGIPVHSITLFLFGGVSNLEREAEKPGVEFTMAIVGPGTSLVMAILFWILYQLIDPNSPANPLIFPAPEYANIFSVILHYLAFINGMLAAFNILPGFPLDGGRVLRSIVWGATSNLVTATNVATMIGRLLGWVFIALGVFQIFGGNIIGGIWIGFIGWFLSSAADSSRQEVTLRERLSGVKVKDVMLHDQGTINPNTTLDELVKGVFSRRFSRAVPVCDADRAIGIITISDIKGIPQDKWSITLVRDVMTREPLFTVKPEDDLNQALRLLGQHDLNQLLVINDGQCTGLISRAEIIRYLQFTQELRLKKK